YRLNAQRQIRRNLRHCAFDVLAERKNISSLPHGDGEADRRLPIHAKHGLRRISMTAPNLRYVAQANGPARRYEVDVCDIVLRPERTRNLQGKTLIAGLYCASRPYDVLSLERGDQCRAINSQAGEFPHRELDENAFVLSP